MSGGGAGALETNLCHTLLEELSILSLPYGIHLGSDEFDPILLEGTRFV
jgi:hypothetical protein